MLEILIPSIIGVFHLVTLVLHMFVQYTIYKAKLKNNQYFLLKMLSLVDLTVPILGLVIVLLKLAGCDGILKKGGLFISLLEYSFTFLAINITLIIVVDRLLAVKYPLRYISMVTKKRLRMAILAFGLLDTIVLIGLLFGFGYQEVATNSIIVANIEIWVYFGTICGLTCFTIVILGKITMDLRDGNEGRLKGLSNIHGETAEVLDVVKKTKTHYK